MMISSSFALFKRGDPAGSLASMVFDDVKLAFLDFNSMKPTAVEHIKSKAKNILDRVDIQSTASTTTIQPRARISRTIGAPIQTTSRGLSDRDKST